MSIKLARWGMTTSLLVSFNISKYSPEVEHTLLYHYSYMYTRIFDNPDKLMRRGGANRMLVKCR